MGRSLNQQTLQHLDALQQQQLRLQVNSPVGGLNLRLAAISLPLISFSPLSSNQGQLLESALKIVTGHAPVTSDVTPSARPQSLQVTEGKTHLTFCHA